MIFAQLFLPAILFAICKAQTYENRDYDEQPLNAPNRFNENLESQQKREQLIDQYRYMIAKSLLRLKDACRIYDYLMGAEPHWSDEDDTNKESVYGKYFFFFILLSFFLKLLVFNYRTIKRRSVHKIPNTNYNRQSCQ